MACTMQRGEKEFESAKLSQKLERTAGAFVLFGTGGQAERRQ